MADTALHSMTENTAPATTDEFYILDNPGGSPADNRISHQNLMKINLLTEDTAPDRTADYLLTYDNSATAAKRVLVGKAAPYIQTFQTVSTSNDPADSSTYYWGPGSAGAWSTAETFVWYVPLAGTITKVDVFFRVAGTAGTTETSTLYLRKNATTDSTITSIIDLSGDYHELKTGLSIAVSAGDRIICKLVTAAWLTNPTDVFSTIQVVVE